MPKVSVVIPTFNGSQTIISCVESILNQSLAPDEILIINNASNDNTVELLERHFGTRIKIIHNPVNGGVTGGRNKGIDCVKSTCDYILFLDHDIDCDINMLKELVKVAESQDNIGIVTAKIYVHGEDKLIWSAGTDINLISGRILFYNGYDEGQHDKVREVAIAPAVILVKRHVAEKIGYFDDIYITTYEDTDYCFRCKKLGYKTYYVPRAVSYHRISIDPILSNKKLLDRAYWVARNRIIFMKKYGKNFLIFLIFIPVYLAYYLNLAIKIKHWQGIISYIKGSLDGLMLILRRAI